MTPDDTPPPRLPVVDLARRAKALEPHLTDAVTRVVRSGAYLFGPELDAFERELAASTGRRHAVGVSSGTDALRLSLVALGIGPGDEVIVPAFTAVPTAAAVCATGAVPVFADVEPDTAGSTKRRRGPRAPSGRVRSSRSTSTDDPPRFPTSACR